MMATTSAGLAVAPATAVCLGDSRCTISQISATAIAHFAIANVTVAATEESLSPSVDFDKAKLASLMAEINTLAGKIAASTAELSSIETFVSNAGGNPAAWKQKMGDYWKEKLDAAGKDIEELQATAEETLKVLDATLAVQKTILESVAQLEILLKQQQDALKLALEAVEGGGGDAAARRVQECECRGGRGAGGGDVG